MTQKITPETAPVGARLLVKRFGQLSEITILEWAPSGERVKYRPATNPKAEIWCDDIEWYALVERLPNTVGGPATAAEAIALSLQGAR